jgi:hypothetical protein
MTRKNQFAIERARLHERAAEIRLRVVASQFSLAFTLCEIAETEIKYGRPDEAISVINKLQRHAVTIRVHLDEPNHFPKNAISDVREQLIKLKERTQEIESHLRQR